MSMLLLGTSTTRCQKFERVQVPTHDCSKTGTRVRLHKFDLSCTHSCTVAQLHCSIVALAVTQWLSDEMQFSRCRQVLSGHFGTFERLSRGGWPDSVQWMIVVYCSLNKKIHNNPIVTENVHNFKHTAIWKLQEKHEVNHFCWIFAFSLNLPIEGAKSFFSPSVRLFLCQPNQTFWFATWDIYLTCFGPQPSSSLDKTRCVCDCWHVRLICICYFK